MIHAIRSRRRLFLASCLMFGGGIITLLAQGQNSPAPPPPAPPTTMIYEKTRPTDPIVQLQKQIDDGTVTLRFDKDHGYLPAVLKALNIPESSQSLVFSKTSLQREAIAPWQPRALYFNNDVYIGWVQTSRLLEVASVDKDLGTIFYTLDQFAVAKPRFERQTVDCLQCHDGSMTSGVPGLMIRSTFTEASGMPMLSIPNYLTSSESPFEERWGGWYVTGKTGNMKHMGNLIIYAGESPKTANLLANANLTDLSRKFDTSRYLAPGSDVVGLMVLTHQAQVHNLMAKVNYHLRGIQHLGISTRKGGQPPAETPELLAELCDPLVREMLFASEKALPNPIEGSSSFAKDFAAQGPRDSKGRSLRDLDLQTRLFKYPVSYLIYSDSFLALPDTAKQYIYRRIFESLTSADRKDPPPSPDLMATVEILRETVKDLPAYWK